MAKTLEADLLRLEQVQEPENASLIGKVMCVLDYLSEIFVPARTTTSRLPALHRSVETLYLASCIPSRELEFMHSL